MDDCLVNSAVGAPPTSWPGQLRAVQLMPTADTAQKDLTPNSGVTNFSRVNEAHMDSDTSYVSGSTAGNTDIYALADLASAPASITAVIIKHAMRKSDTGLRTATTRVVSGGVNYDQPTVTLATTYQWQNTIYVSDPNTAVAWTFAGVNALQVVPRIVA